MSEYQMQAIQGSINDRQRELHNVTDILARRARQATIRSDVSRVVVILLGAVVATREAANQIAGAGNTVAIVVYALFGVLIAAVAGLQAAFKWETSAADLRLLAATCQSTVRFVDSQWQKDIGTASSSDPMGRLEAARKLIDLQDAKLTEVQAKAAEVGVNITLEVRELEHGPIYAA
jgi:hypothetical protein